MTVHADQLPQYVTEKAIVWQPTDDWTITFDRVTQLYVAERIEFSETAQDWVCAEILPPAASLRKACEFNLILP